MGDLFHVSGDDIALVKATSFGSKHREKTLQLWAEAHPRILNRGQPMVSLGMEIETRHKHSIDNLFVDGNGHIVVAELKRGMTPRDVAAQAIDYGAFASSLDWADLNEYCAGRHGEELGSQFETTFGFKLDMTRSPEHRLLIVAESFAPQVVDAATYLINQGLPLALLGFTYFELAGEQLFDCHVVLGEIPDQRATAPNIARTALSDQGSEADAGLVEWLLTSVRTSLPEIEKARGLTFEVRQGQHQISFAPRHWDLPYGEAHFRVSVHVRQVGVYFHYRTESHPSLYQRLITAIDAGRTPFSRERVTSYAKYTSLSHLFPMPSVGDMQAIGSLLGDLDALVGLVNPLVSDSR